MEWSDLVAYQWISAGYGDTNVCDYKDRNVRIEICLSNECVSIEMCFLCSDRTGIQKKKKKQQNVDVHIIVTSLVPLCHVTHFHPISECFRERP